MEMRSVIRYVWPLLFGVACATDDTDPDQDLGDLEGIEEVGEGLSQIEDCAFATGTMTLQLDSGDIALVNRRSDGKVVINGYECDGATSTTLKQLVVTEKASAAGTAQTLIVDHLGGTFALGLSTGEGINVNLGGGTDALKIRGTKLADKYIFGKDAILLNSDNYKDIVYAGVETFVVTMSDGADFFYGTGGGGTAGTLSGDPFEIAVTVYGGAGNDTIQGGIADDTYYGGDDDDTFLAGADYDGADIMYGGANTTNGGDTADYSLRTADLTITLDDTADDGDPAADTGAGELDDVRGDVEKVKGGEGADTITGSASKNTVYGGKGDDVIDGGGEADTLYGGDDDDTLTGGAGNDVLYGENGDDTFLEGTANSGADTFNGGAGTDTVSYAARAAVGVTVTIDTAATDGETGASEGDKVVTDVENVIGTDFGDVITGSTSNNRLEGGAGADTLNGGSGNDTLVGGAGNDTLNGDAGDDTFDESNSVDGTGTGNDTMLGSTGTDTVSYAGRVNALVVVMDHNSTTPGTSSGDTVNGEADKVGDDIENLMGGDEADTLTGNGLDNQLEGGAAIDTIYGGAGNDTIDGGLVDEDIIDCGAGDGDILLDSTVDATSVGLDPADAGFCEL